MNKFEMYDIIKLQNQKEYSILRMLDLNNKNYYLLAEIDEEENPILDELIIVEIRNNKIIEINDENELKELKELFLSALDANI